MVTSRKPPLSKKNLGAQLRLAKLLLTKPHVFWSRLLLTDMTKEEIFSHDPQRDPQSEKEIDRCTGVGSAATVVDVVKVYRFEKRAGQRCWFTHP